MNLHEKILQELPYAVTVCDINGDVIFMNDKSISTFQKGDESLIGKSLFDCHGPQATAKIKQMLAEGGANSYTIEKAGLKKLIYQSPWFENGKIAGLIELSLVIPEEMPHFVRK